MLARHKNNPPNEVMLKRYDPSTKRYYRNNLTFLINTIRVAIKDVIGIDPFNDTSSRKKEYVHGRQLFCFFLVTIGNISHNKSGAFLDKDRVTVLKALEKVKNHYACERDYRKSFDQIESKLSILKS
jgi:hypothetical protein